MLGKHRTNNNNELGLLAVWKDARPYEKEIELEILSSFKLIQKAEINWTDKNFYENSCRLYETPFSSNNKQEKYGAGHTKKIGSPNFLIYLIKDENPNYRYVPSVSGSIELCNTNVINLKEKLRSYIYEKTNELYSIHSTNNFNEFCFQAPLLLGLENSHDLIEGKSVPLNKKYESDLIGADGWNNYRDLFKALNATINYCVLRGFEHLPEKNPEKDLDLLTDDYQRLASVIGMDQAKSKPYKGSVLIAGERVSVDIRYIGDHYFDTKFQIKILRNKIFRDDIYVLKDDDYFFSLLYHCKVHKHNVKPSYFEVLDKLAKNLNLDWFDKIESLNDNNSSKILNGYYRAHGYVYESPIDKDVFANKKIIKHLPSHEEKLKFKTQLKNVIRKMIPEVLLLQRRKILNFWK